MRKRVQVAALLAGVLILGACKSQKKDEEPKIDPSPLLKPAMSTWNFEKTRRTLNYDHWETIEDRKPLVSDKRPPFRILIIKVPNYKDHGYTGNLVLQFYNDRLMRSQYYVDDMKGYLNVAGADEKVALGNDKSGHIEPHTRVWLGKEADGHEYLGMEDEILKQQMNDWINRYSAG